MNGEETIIRDLTGALGLMGFQKGNRKIETDGLGFKNCLLAKWKIQAGATADIRCYFADYFGAPRVWVGFGSPNAQNIELVIRGIKKTAFSTIQYSDWDGLNLANKRKMAEVRRNSFTTYENYLSQRKGWWVWFGRYFTFKADTSLKALHFIETVINSQRLRMPMNIQEWEGPTETTSQIKIRLSQGRFREAMLDRWNSKCAVTGSGVVPILEASHIKQWSAANDVRIRMSADNGLLLLPTLHALFDKGLISFSDAGRIIIKDDLTLEKQKKLNINSRMKLRHRPTANQKRYLKYHRAQSELE
jgi:hypothetical protein